MGLSPPALEIAENGKGTSERVNFGVKISGMASNTGFNKTKIHFFGARVTYCKYSEFLSR